MVPVHILHSLNISKKCYPWYANPNSGCPVLDVNGRMGARNFMTLCPTEQLLSLSRAHSRYIRKQACCLLWDIVALTAQHVFKTFTCIKNWTVSLFQEELNRLIFFLSFLFFFLTFPPHFFFLPPTGIYKTASTIHIAWIANVITNEKKG